MNSVDKSIKLFGRASGVFSKKFVLSDGIPLLIFGKEAEKDRFVMLKVGDFFKLIGRIIKDNKK